MPLRVIPDRGQVPENAAKPLAWLLSWATKQTCDVLHENELGSKVASKSKEFGVKAASCALAKAATSACRTDILAGESPNDDVGNNSVCGKPFGGDLSDIAIHGHSRPILVEDAHRERLNFTERHGLESARALQPKVEAANTGEQRKDAQLRHARPLAIAMVGRRLET
jgi:hypothetical protein